MLEIGLLVIFLGVAVLVVWMISLFFTILQSQKWFERLSSEEMSVGSAFAFAKSGERRVTGALVAVTILAYSTFPLILCGYAMMVGVLITFLPMFNGIAVLFVGAISYYLVLVVYAFFFRKPQTDTQVEVTPESFPELLRMNRELCDILRVSPASHLIVSSGASVAVKQVGGFFKRIMLAPGFRTTNLVG